MKQGELSQQESYAAAAAYSNYYYYPPYAVGNTSDYDYLNYPHDAYAGYYYPPIVAGAGGVYQTDNLESKDPSTKQSSQQLEDGKVVSDYNGSSSSDVNHDNVSEAYKRYYCHPIYGYYPPPPSDEEEAVAATSVHSNDTD